jgi:hypothetical protein
LALTLAVYTLVIRRVNWVRWLFGMKPHRSIAEKVKVQNC